jgi:hypothetical protein
MKRTLEEIKTAFKCTFGPESSGTRDNQQKIKLVWECGVYSSKEKHTQQRRAFERRFHQKQDEKNA